MSEVCKEWHELVNSEEVWLKKLISSGFTHDNVESFKKKFTFSSKEFYQRVTTKKGLLEYLYGANGYSKNFTSIKISDALFSIMKKSLIQVDTDKAVKVKRDFLTIMTEPPLSLHHSLPDFFANRLFNKKIEDERQIHTTNSEEINKISTILSNNSKLINILMKINHQDCPVFHCASKLIYHGDQWVSAIPELKSSLISYNNHLLYIFESSNTLTEKKVFEKLIRENLYLKISPPNFNFYFIIEVSESGLELLSFQFSCNEKIYLKLSETMNEAQNQLIADLEDQSLQVNNPTFS